jgi:ferric-dicitrate binding protein FerR (iron transport regulator)
MAKTKKAKAAVPYARRLLEDEYVQEQLRNAAGGLRTAYERARRERGKAAEDKHLYSNLRHAATSIRNAATALQRPKPAPKPKRRARKVAILVLAVGGCALLTIRLQKHHQTPADSAIKVEPQGVQDDAAVMATPSAPTTPTTTASPTTPTTP